MDEADAAAAAETAGETEVLTALDAKGLEFDNVVLYNPGRLLPVASRADASLLLIAATRATRNQAIVEPG
jgi:DNA helicase IV